ncbi:MAG: hypothetical protein R3A47_00430 [Polyangiales bacterium]
MECAILLIGVIALTVEKTNELNTRRQILNAATAAAKTTPTPAVEPTMPQPKPPVSPTKP